MQISIKTWEKNHNSVSVNFGPLTFSLKIEEWFKQFDSTETAIGDSKWQEDADPTQWPSFEIHPASAWNYGLVLDAKEPGKSFKLIKKAWPQDNFLSCAKTNQHLKSSTYTNHFLKMAH